MKKKMVWLLLSGLVALSLLLASCAPAPKEVTPTTPTAPTAPTAPKEAVTPKVEVPKYGGRLIIGTENRNIMPTFDDLYHLSGTWFPPHTITHESLLMGDWTMGAAGTNEADFFGSNFAPLGIFQETGALATSWEIPDAQTLIFKIRQGVHWWNKPPVNGRELDAKDIAYTLELYYLHPTVIFHGRLTAPAGHKLVSATATDKWTVVVKVTGLAQIFFEDLADKVWIIAHESIEKYGDTKDWKNILGTGPFMLTDYVPMSSMMLVKNPNYWMKDPVGPGKGNQLPYLDSLLFLVIGDRSTQMAALRTSKIDHLWPALYSEDAENLAKYSPQIKVLKKSGGSPMALVTRSTSTLPVAAPLMKKRVRQALAMAIDHPSIIKDYYRGDADFMFFFAPTSPYFTPLKDMAEILQRVHGFSPEDSKIVEKMFGYYPEEAKKILAEEGYPNGFKVTIMTRPADVDIVSIAKDYLWKNLKVDLTLELKEPAVFSQLADNRQFDAMVYFSGGMVGWVERWNAYGPSAMTGPRVRWNVSEVIDPVMNGAATRFEAVYGDVPARNKIIKEVEPYALQTGWWIAMPYPYPYQAWQPWLKNYHGETSVGYRNSGNWVTWAWLDQDLKEEMTGRR